MVTKETLLQQLPEYQDKWILINPSQKVHDIIKEVLAAHDNFASYYDRIAIYFDGFDSLDELASNLYSFCKKNLHYNEESEDFQSTSVPQGLLSRGECDCKGYANFIGGILDGLNRLGHKIKWNYRFASYDLLNNSPHHVFIVLNDNGREIFIDPTPGSEAMQPIWNTDKKISARPTGNKIGALHSNIGSIPNNNSLMRIGAASLTLTPFTGDNLDFDGDHKYAGVFDPYLGLSSYHDFGGDRNLNGAQCAAALNALIAQGPSPGHTVDGDFVEWIYNESIRSWNFYYIDGVQPGFTAINLIPSGYPKWEVDIADSTMTLDPAIPLDDYRNALIHLMVAWAQSNINAYSMEPFPVTPRNVKEFSQGKLGGNFLDLPATAGFFKKLQQYTGALGMAVPRAGYLFLIAHNWFGMAKKLYRSIYKDDGTPDLTYYSKVRDLWERVGGRFETLEGAILKAHERKAVDSKGNEITADTTPEGAQTVGEIITFAAAVAGAVAIIGAMAPIIEQALKSKTAATGINYNTNPATGLPYPLPAIPTTSGSIQSAITNNLPLIAIGAGALMLLTKKKKRTVSGTDNMLPMLLIGGGAAMLLLKKKAVTVTTNPGNTGTGSGNTGGGGVGPGPSTVSTQRAALLQWNDSDPTESAGLVAWYADVFNRMSDAEIADSYNYVFNYYGNNIPIPVTNMALMSAIAAIRTKYNIFN